LLYSPQTRYGWSSDRWTNINCWEWHLVKRWKVQSILFCLIFSGRFLRDTVHTG
jgi:hypothetical protein